MPPKTKKNKRIAKKKKNNIITALLDWTPTGIRIVCLIVELMRHHL